MKMKTIIVLAFAVGCGLIAMMGVQQMISKQSNTQDVPVKVLVATADIPPGVLLCETNCAFEEYPSSAVPKDAVRSKEDYFERGLKVPVDEGDIIRMVKLGTRGEIAASASIPKGMRLFTFKVDDTKTHSGLLQPGDRVDLQITFEYVAFNNRRVTRTDTLLEYIEVFASDAVRNQEVGESREIKAKNLSLLVTPMQSNLLKLASSKGELTPIMRNKEDKEIANPNGVDDNLLSLLKTGFASQEEGSQESEAVPVSTKDISPADALKNSLSNGFVEQTEPVEKELVIQSATWTLEIYSGDEVISHDFLLEAEEKNAEANEGANSSPASKQRTKSTLTRVLSRPIQGMLDSIMNPKKQETDSATKSEETLEEASDEDLKETELEGEFQTEDDFKEEQERQREENTVLLIQ